MWHRLSRLITRFLPRDHAVRAEPAALPLEARGVSVLRGGRAVLRQIDLAVGAGQVVALHGANGSGKSTLLRCLAGALRPAAGEVLWCGVADTRTPAARRLVGLLGHETGLYHALTARENLLFAARMYGLDGAADRAAELLRAAGLEARAGQQTGRLSRGQRQRLALARVLIHRPPVLLLDEPFTSLDAGGRDWLTSLLGDLRAGGRAVLLASHDTDHSRHLADRTLTLRNGRLNEPFSGTTPRSARADVGGAPTGVGS